MDDRPKKPHDTPEAQRRRRAARIAAGICLECKEPALPGKTQCVVHRDKRRKQEDSFPSHAPWNRKEHLAKKRAEGICYSCLEPAVPDRRLCAKHLESHNQSNKRRYERETRQWHNARYRVARQQVIAGYGGACICCGETEPVFLAIDHMNGGGNQEHKYLNGYTLLIKLIREHFPAKYQILCHNCNVGKKFGICPHREKLK